MRFLVSSGMDFHGFGSHFDVIFETYLSFSGLWSLLFRKSRFWDPFEKNIAFRWVLLSVGRLKRPNWFIFYKKVASKIWLVPKSGFYWFLMTFGTPNNLLLEALGSSNFNMASLGTRFGDPLGPNLELLTKSNSKMTPKSLKCHPKVSKLAP